MRYLISATLVVVAVIHLLPLSGVFGGERLSALYGIPFTDPNLAILMRHRAVLFGLLGSFFLFAAFRSQFHTVAFIVGFVSVVTFLLLAWITDGYNAQISRVVVADIVALICLTLGFTTHIFIPRAG